MTEFRTQPPPQGKDITDSSAGSQPSIWVYKPWWCQPWSILLTGFSIIFGSWYVLKIWWVTGIVAVPIVAWMSFFLVVYPRLMQDTMDD